MKKFVPQLNIEDDKVYVYLMSNSCGYTIVGEVFCRNVDSNRNVTYVVVPIYKDGAIYFQNYSQKWNYFYEWSLYMYNKFQLSKNGWYDIYEFDSKEEAMNFLNKLRLSEKLKK